MKIVLNSDNVKRVRELISLCPDVFSYVPFKIFNDTDGKTFASIEMLSLNGDIVFSGKVELEDVGLEAETGMVVRLPLNKTIINNIFSEAYESVEIDKTKIRVKDSKRKLSLSLFELDDTEIMEFPYTNEEIFELVNEKNDTVVAGKGIVNLDSTEIKEFLGCFDILSNPDNVIINMADNVLHFSSEDFTGNSFEYKIPSEIESEPFSSKYDNNLIKVFNNISKFKEYEFNTIFSPLIVAVSIKDKNLMTTIAVTALKD